MKKYILTFLFSFIFTGNADHLLLNKVCITPDEAEMIEIYNPLDEPVDLSNYYLSDSNKYYQWINGESIGAFDFLINFPSGTIIQPGDTYIITTQEDDVFYEYYGYSSDFSIIDESDANPEPGEPGYQIDAKLSSEEMLMLFYWDGASQTIQDVDYFLWGDYDSGVFKSTNDEYSFDDTLIENQNFIRSYVANCPSDSIYVRNNIDETEENQINGNGITGHDETSENFNISWTVQEINTATLFQNIINDAYDCGGDSRDACPLCELDCPIVNVSGTIVDYFDITQFGGPHALTIEDEYGYRLELTIWPDTWDIANDLIYSDLLQPPYNRYYVKALGNVFEYQGEKQILVCGSGEAGLNILQNYSVEGQFYDYEPFEDINGDGTWTASYCENPQFDNESDCITENFKWIEEEPYEDLNGNGIWDSPETLSFNTAKIFPAPFVLVPSMNEVLDFSYSFPSNSRVIIRVFDLSGRFITTLIDKYYESTGIVKREEFFSAWDGTNEMDQVQIPCTYLMHIEASNFQNGTTTTDIAPVVIGINK